MELRPPADESYLAAVYVRAPADSRQIFHAPTAAELPAIAPPSTGFPTTATPHRPRDGGTPHREIPQSRATPCCISVRRIRRVFTAIPAEIPCPLR
jgi:rubredoxin